MTAVLRLVAVFGFVMMVNACAMSSSTARDTRAVAFRYQRVDGKIDTLGRHRGKVVLVSVFATWAEPALLEVPFFGQLQRRFGSDDFVVIQIAIDQEPSAVEVFVEAFGVEHLVGWPVDPGRFTGRLGPLGPIGILPTSVLITRDGVAAYHREGTWAPKDLEAAIVSLLAADRINH
jgi:hypothetical protein